MPPQRGRGRFFCVSNVITSAAEKKTGTALTSPTWTQPVPRRFGARSHKHAEEQGGRSGWRFLPACSLTAPHQWELWRSNVVEPRRSAQEPRRSESSSLSWRCTAKFLIRRNWCATQSSSELASPNRAPGHPPLLRLLGRNHRGGSLRAGHNIRNVRGYQEGAHGICTDKQDSKASSAFVSMKIALVELVFDAWVFSWLLLVHSQGHSEVQ